MIRRPPRPTLFPYTPLSRSLWSREEVDVHAADASRAELDVTGTEPAVRAGLLPALKGRGQRGGNDPRRPLCEDARLRQDRKSTRLNSSHSQISYAVFCLKKK